MTSASRTAEEERCYRVRGPYLLAGGAPPPDGLEVIAESEFSVVVHTGYLGKEEWMGRLEIALDARGANALVDCRAPESGILCGRPALVVRVNRLGEDGIALLSAAFHPQKDPIKLMNVVLPKEPADRGRILRVVLFSCAAFLGVLFLFLLAGVLLTLLFAS